MFYQAKFLVSSSLEEYMFSCPWKKYFNMECLGCGLQRSLLLVLKGNFIEAFKMYPAIYTLILMFIFLVLHLRFNFVKGHKIILVLFTLNIIIIVSSYIFKLIY